MDKTYDLVMVDWEDSTCRSGWHKPEFAPKFPDQCVTVGFILRRDPKSITLAQSLCEDRSVDGSWLIPRVNIRKIQILIKVKAPKAKE